MSAERCSVAISRLRWTLILVIAATAAAGITLRALVDGPVAKYGGVALWAMLVYWLVVWIRPRLRPRDAGAIAMIVSLAVELLQLTPLPSALSSRHFVLRLVFGTTFHLPDLPAYALGVVLAVCCHGWLLRR